MNSVVWTIYRLQLISLFSLLVPTSLRHSVYIAVYILLIDYIGNNWYLLH
jgi:hypothetical protein